MERSNSWKLKDILMVAITAMLFGVVYLGTVYIGQYLTVLLTPAGYGILGNEPVFGVWFMAAVFTSYVIQKPGVGVVAEMLAALLEVMMGNFYGPIIFVSGFIQGIGAEIGFGIFRYKKFNYATTMLSAVLCTVLSFLWTGLRYAYWTLDPKLVLSIFVIRLISSVIFCGIGCKLLGDALSKAGVLKGYALGRKSLDLDEE